VIIKLISKAPGVSKKNSMSTQRQVNRVKSSQKYDIINSSINKNFTEPFGMFDYSTLIVEAMKYIDEKIENLNSNSVNKTRLHSKINIQIVANIKEISLLEQADAYKTIDNIFNVQLLAELSRHI